MERLVLSAANEWSVAIGTHPGSGIRFSTARRGVAPRHAVLTYNGSNYRLDVDPSARVWINGQPMRSAILDSGDVLEIGDDGPVVRFRVYPGDRPIRKSVAEVFSDCVGCAKHGSEGVLDKARVLLGGIPAELATQTSVLFRILTIAAIAALAFTTWSLARRSARLEDQLTTEQQRVGGLAALLERSETSMSDEQELAQLREAFDDRLTALEERSEAEQRIVSEAVRSVVYLQGSYGFVEPESQRMLRLVDSGAPGLVVSGPDGTPMTTLEGSGPIIDVRLTGTGFLIGDDLVLTNRHVALPWEFDVDAQKVIQQGYQARPIRFLGYLPEIAQPFAVEFVAASDAADVAVLRCSQVANELPALPISQAPPRLGDGVLVLGYPTGVRALLARADRDFVTGLRRREDLDFWKIAEALSAAGHIGPLASRGIISQVSPEKVVYDAETTSGGSGGPVLSLDGEVIAVNAAIIPEFGGSNLGVPASFALDLLDQVQSLKATDEPGESPAPAP